MPGARQRPGIVAKTLIALNSLSFPQSAHFD